MKERNKLLQKYGNRRKGYFILGRKEYYILWVLADLLKGAHIKKGIIFNRGSFQLEFATLALLAFCFKNQERWSSSFSKSNKIICTCFSIEYYV